MKTILLFISIFSVQLNVFAQSSKTFVQSLALQKVKSIIIDLQNPYVVETYSGNVVRVETSVQLKNGSKQVLKTLCQQGKYRLKVSHDKKSMLVMDNTPHKEVHINGVAVEESISYTLYIPEGYIILTKRGHNDLAAK